MPDIRLLIFNDLHVEERLDVFEETRQNGRQRKVRSPFGLVEAEEASEISRVSINYYVYVTNASIQIA